MASQRRKPGRAVQLRNFIMGDASGWMLLWSSLSVGIILGIVTFFTADGGFAVGSWPQFWFDVVMGAFVGTILAGFAILVLADIYVKVVDGILEKRSKRAEQLPRPLVRYRPGSPHKRN